MITRVVRNDWSHIGVPEIGRWRPAMTVSVVIPAYNCQESLSLTLASLSHQTYPAGLLEVVVVDDGSQPPLELPPIRPERTRVIRAADHSEGWGRANALSVGASQSRGEIIHWLDADMIVFPEHVEAQARWHHEVPYAVTLGTKRFVDVRPGGPGWPEPETVATGGLEALFDPRTSEPHDYIEKMIRRTDGLRAGDHLTFMVHVGATAALRREMYEAAGGVDPRLHLGEDTELGYRLTQAGAVFVPELHARSWHLGRTHMMRDAERLQRYNRPFLADLMPHPRWLRKVGGSAWTVPLVSVVVDASGEPLELVRAAVDAILANDETDLRVHLVGAWDKLIDERRSVLTDPLLDLRLIAASYRGDPRVRLVERAPETAFPSPYLLRVPVRCGLGRSAIGRIVEAADQAQAGVVRTPLPGDGDGRGHGGGGAAVELWRTAALGRARWLRDDGEPLIDVVSQTHGARSLPAEAVGVIDLSRFEPAQLAAGIGAAAEGLAGRWLPNAVEVAGVRSLARAAVVVGRLTAARARARVRRAAARSREPDGEQRS
jgi:glycosyltransferase involved in cell wall biosynthesis